jgi:sarcosine oxidase delta subunit
VPCVRSKLSLQKIVYLLHPSKATLVGVLHPLTKRMSECSGGRLLDVLHSLLLEQGDSKARAVLLHILDQASAPFLEMLSSWLFRGDLNDPYQEFMIKEDASVSRDALQEDFNAQYWEHRYTLREQAIPKILRDHANKALIAGKYLNVVRECVEELLESSNTAANTSSISNQLLVNYQVINKEATESTASTTTAAATAEVGGGSETEQTRNSLASVSWIRDLHLPSARKLSLDLHHSNSSSSSLAEAIHDAYTFSSQALLQLLKQSYLIHEHLRSLRRFFLYVISAIAHWLSDLMFGI